MKTLPPAKCKYCGTKINRKIYPQSDFCNVYCSREQYRENKRKKIKEEEKDERRKNNKK